MADIRVSQNLAQVEWQESGIMKIFQVLAQVEYTETTDETEKLINLTSTITETDLLHKFETGLSVSITATISDTDLQVYIDIDLLVPISVTVSITDTCPIDESYKLVNIVFIVEETDLQDFVESREVILSLTPAEISIQNFLDHGLLVSASLTVSVFDSIPCDESYLQVAITSTVSETDNYAQTENVTISISLVITKTDIYTQIEELALLLNMSVNIFDAFYENLLVLINIEVNNISGYPTGARKIFELIGRHE